jgi:hypothetical protein
MSQIAEAPLRVVVQVEAPDGWQGAYTLQAPGDAVPTGFGEEDGGAAAGLGPDEVGAPLPAAVGGPHPAWESGTGIGAEVPGASLGIARSSYLTEPLTTDRSRDLWAALVPVDRDRWLAALEEADPHLVDDADWGSTLAATDVADTFFGSDEGDSDSDSGSGSGSASGEAVGLPEVLPRDGLNPAAGQPEDEVHRIVADALLAFVGGGSSVDADLFGPTTSFTFEDGPGPLVVPIEEVAAGPTDGDATPPPATEAWYLLQNVAPAELSDLLAAPDECPPLEAVAAEPATVVVYQGSDDGGTACSSWSALVIRLDDQQRIVSVDARYGE